MIPVWFVKINTGIIVCTIVEHGSISYFFCVLFFLLLLFVMCSVILYSFLEGLKGNFTFYLLCNLSLSKMIANWKDICFFILKIWLRCNVMLHLQWHSSPLLWNCLVCPLYIFTNTCIYLSSQGSHWGCE